LRTVSFICKPQQRPSRQPSGRFPVSRQSGSRPVNDHKGLSGPISKTQATSVLPGARQGSRRLSAAEFPEADFWPLEGFNIQVKNRLSQNRLLLGRQLLACHSEENAKLNLQLRLRQ